MAGAVLIEQAVDEAPKRSEVGLTVVVDRSGSMTGPRIDMLKNTLRFLASQSLQRNDAMGLIIFGNKVSWCPGLRRTQSTRRDPELRSMRTTAVRCPH